MTRYRIVKNTYGQYKIQTRGILPWWSDVTCMSPMGTVGAKAFASLDEARAYAKGMSDPRENVVEEGVV